MRAVGTDQLAMRSCHAHIPHVRGKTKMLQLAPLTDHWGNELVSVRTLRVLPHARKALLAGIGRG